MTIPHILRRAFDLISRIKHFTIEFLLVIASFFFLVCINFPTAYASKIVELKINGPIGPATADYIVRGISKAQNADLILVILDTPGGLDGSTRIITKEFLNSKTPIVTYVSPNGARAASAGTFLLYASTLAAMAPGTQLGAASPVQISAGFDDGSKENKKSATMDAKIKNDAVATIRALAQLRGRDPDFAQKAVLEAATLTSSEALKVGAINFVAKSTDDLLMQINGKTVIQNNKSTILNTSSPEIIQISPDWRTRFLSVITEPTVAYLLLLLGIYGIFFELMSPGYVLPGVVGAVSILIALYALQLLPVNYAGLAFIILGIIFIIAEGVTPSFGALGIGGTVAFVLGSILLMDTEYGPFQIARSVIVAMALVNIIVFIFLISVVFKSRHQRVRNGLELLIGVKGRALNHIDEEGQAVIRGEIWSVHTNQPIAADKTIKVVAVKGLMLEVEEDSAEN